MSESPSATPVSVVAAVFAGLAEIFVLSLVVHAYLISEPAGGPLSSAVSALVSPGRILLPSSGTRASVLSLTTRSRTVISFSTETGMASAPAIPDTVTVTTPVLYVKAAGLPDWAAFTVKSMPAAPDDADNVAMPLSSVSYAGELKSPILNPTVVIVSDSSFNALDEWSRSRTSAPPVSLSPTTLM